MISTWSNTRHLWPLGHCKEPNDHSIFYPSSELIVSIHGNPQRGSQDEKGRRIQFCRGVIIVPVIGLQITIYEKLTNDTPKQRIGTMASQEYRKCQVAWRTKANGGVFFDKDDEWMEMLQRPNQNHISAWKGELRSWYYEKNNQRGQCGR